MILVSPISSLPNPLKPGVQVENDDVVGARPTGNTPTTSEWSTILLPKVRLILEVWWYWWIYVNSLSCIRVASLALGQSYDCPSASEVTLKDMGQSIGTIWQMNINHVHNFGEVLYTSTSICGMKYVWNKKSGVLDWIWTDSETTKWLKFERKDFF